MGLLSCSVPGLEGWRPSYFLFVDTEFRDRRWPGTCLESESEMCESFINMLNRPEPQFLAASQQEAPPGQLGPDCSAVPASDLTSHPKAGLREPKKQLRGLHWH